MVEIFSVNQQLLQTIQAIYPNLEVVSLEGRAIETIANADRKKQDRNIHFYAMIAPKNMLVCCFKEQRLHYASTFNVENDNDRLYYIMGAWKSLQMNVVKINYRPIELEASYPSSHTMLGLCVMSSEIAILHYSAKRLHFWAIIFQIICFVSMVAMVVFRLLSGVHWLTDIVGSVILSCSLISLYCATLVLYGRHRHHHHR